MLPAAVALVCEITGGRPGPRYELDACLGVAPFGSQAGWHTAGVRTIGRRVAAWPWLERFQGRGGDLRACGRASRQSAASWRAA
jgi:hypothetical protein